MVAVVGPTGVKWVDWLIIAGFIVTTIGLLWRKVLKPLVESISVAVDIAPVLGFIPDEDGKRTTLKDSLHEIVEAVSEVKEAVSTVVAEQQTQGEKLDEQGEKLDVLHTYAHDQNHNRQGEITKLVLADEVMLKKLDQLATHMESVPAKLEEIATAASAADEAAVEARGHTEQPEK